MGLFQKIKASEKTGDELNEYVENLLQNSDKMSNEEIDEKFSVESMSLNNAAYSIDQVIDLMRDLPADAGSIVVSTVTKTLESANINVSKIVEDAFNKESSLTSQISKLNDEIDSLKDQIAKKKDQINVSSAILDETKKVRELLENATTASKTSMNNPASSKKTSNVSSIKERVSEEDAVKMALEAQ